MNCMFWESSATTRPSWLDKTGWEEQPVSEPSRRKAKEGERQAKSRSDRKKGEKVSETRVHKHHKKTTLISLFPY